MLETLNSPFTPVGITGDRKEFGQFLQESAVLYQRRRSEDPRYLAKLAEVALFVAEITEGKRPAWQFQEAMSTSDFPLYFGDILDRSVIGNYRAYTATWQAYCRRGTVRDFRIADRYYFDGLDGRLYPQYDKPELAGVQEDNVLTEGRYRSQVAIYEKATSISWQTLMNDDLDAFADIPRRMALGARRTEEYLATTLFVDANGPHASLYTAGNANIINTSNGAASNNPALSVQGLTDGLNVLARQVDAVTGEPIVYDLVHLVVPPALRVTAQNILNAIQIEMNVNGGTITGLSNSSGSENRLIVRNWITNGIRLHVNPYIPIVATSNDHTSWFLFADPSEARPALEMTFLRGYEEPLVLRKAPDVQRLGGGILAEMGDFEHMEHRLKVVHILGGNRMDGKATVASNGSGS